MKYKFISKILLNISKVLANVSYTIENYVIPYNEDNLPMYVAVGNKHGTTMRLDGDVYYRDCGDWSTKFVVHPASINIDFPQLTHLHGLKLVPISYNRWIKQNR
jgi:hypothetical protein